MEQFIQMKVKLGLIAIIPLLFTNCKQDAQKVQQPMASSPTIPLQWHSKDWYAATCAGDSMQCMRLKVHFPLLADSSQMATQINDTILANLQHLLAPTLSVASEASDMNLDEWAQYLLDDYETMVREDSTYEIPWEIKLVADSLYQNSYLLSLKMEFYAFTGGAHPNVRQVLMNFDLSDGHKIALQSLLSNERRLKQLLINEDQGGQEEQIDLQNLEFPENFAVVEKGLYFLYNPLEVVAYGLTLTEFTLPYEAIEETLNEKGKILFNYN